ncbi:DUF1643 domain-containing protein [uncultured Eudoraea sp.]|uniref:DUF1643 domain-containing protein n=1 Tax=uncultured Eudoraea sp. TaxID=1035614 RepID=UPI002611A46A|nr:DUF1643 domain-containing protein [uncultured Eudoraea sp.]
MIHKHIPGVKVKAKFSDCKKFRYQLTIENITKTKGDSLCVIMQNPSIANTEIADKSVQFLEKLIFEKEVELFKNVKTIIIVNQFARIQTKYFKGKVEDIGTDNDIHIRNAMDSSNTILIAWGKTNPFLKRQQDILRIISSFKDKKVLMAKKHPSRGTYQKFLVPFSN